MTSVEIDGRIMVHVKLLTLRFKVESSGYYE